MNKYLSLIASLVFAAAFLSPIWVVSLASAGQTNDIKQYNGLQSMMMGVYNLIPIIPSFIFLMIAQKKGQVFYLLSIVASVCSLAFMGLWAFGALS